MKAKQIMTSPVITGNEKTPLEEIARLMLQNNMGGVPIVDDSGRLCGIVTESDFIAKNKPVPFSLFKAPQLFGDWLSPAELEKIYDAARKITAADIMTKHVVVADESESVHNVMLLMLDNAINRIPIVRDGMPVGIVARHDILKLMAKH